MPLLSKHTFSEDELDFFICLFVSLQVCGTEICVRYSWPYADSEDNLTDKERG